MNDWVLGLAWTGHMLRQNLLQAAARLPQGLGEIYFHPAADTNERLEALMPDYDHRGELAALLDPAVGVALASVAPIRGWLSRP